MKILLFDPYGQKFTDGMVKWWEANGHEVKYERYYNPLLVGWADVIWFDTCDNNLMSAMSPSESLQQEWIKDGVMVSDMHDMDLTGKKVIVRPIDIEVWQGHHANARLWDIVDDCIFIAPHIRDIMMADSRPQESNMQIHVIPCAVDLEKYTFKVRELGYNIGIVSEVWESKGVDYVLQIALKLRDIDPRYQITWVGKFQDYHWDKAYMDDFIQRNHLPIKFLDWVESVDDFLDDKNYLLHASKKEAFSYATAEAMAKGIKPILHRFYGADVLWPGLTWNSIDEAVAMITNKVYDSQSYRDYLVEMRYTLPQMMESIQQVLEA